MDITELKQQRRQAAHRKRGLIFNDDGCPMVYTVKEASPEALLAERTTGLLGTHLGSIFYCPWTAGLGHVTYPSDVAEPFYADSGIFAANMTRTFHEQGLDPVQIMIDFARKHRIEIVVSMRMNDIHDGYPQWREMLPQFKKDHPHLLHGSEEEPPLFGFWSGMTYDEQAVQDRAFEILEDICSRYDLDGIELDWQRHPPHFRCSTRGEDCTSTERDIMTRFHRRLRDMTEQVGLERGRPLLTAVRVPASIACCEAIGLDVSAWVEQDLVDLLCPGEWELSPWNEWVALGKQFDKPVYPSMSWSGSRKRQGPIGTTDGMGLRNFRARAMNVWHAECDGVSTFNLFDPTNSFWAEGGDPKVLARLGKDYFPDGHFRFLLGRDIRDLLRFCTLPTMLDPEIPVPLEPTRPFDVAITIGEDPGQDPTSAVTVSVCVEGLTAAEGIIVSLNGQKVEGGTLKGRWVSYPVASIRIKKGLNEIRVINREPTFKRIVLHDVHVGIRYGRD